MRIDLNKDQYFSLIKLVGLGNIMANSFRNDDERIRKFDEAAGLFLSQAERFGLGDYVEVCQCAIGPHNVPSARLLDDPDYVMCQEDYDDELFWTELEERLADRDLRRQIGSRQLTKLNETELTTRLKPLVEHYAQETERFGLDRLEVREWPKR